MNEPNTPAHDHQAPDSPREAKPACTARNHSLWVKLQDRNNPEEQSIPEKFNLSGPETSILLCLGVRCGMNPRWSWEISQAQIARDTQLSLSAVKAAIKRLISLGLIIRTAGSGPRPRSRLPLHIPYRP